MHCLFWGLERLKVHGGGEGTEENRLTRGDHLPYFRLHVTYLVLYFGSLCGVRVCISFALCDLNRPFSLAFMYVYSTSSTFYSNPQSAQGFK